MTLEVGECGHAGSWELALPADRARLVRLCAYLTGDADAAEDLAQETLVEAWRHAHKLHDPECPHGRAQWLTAIARNVCLRWTRRRGRELSRLAQPLVDAELTGTGWEDWPADGGDVEAELERDELAGLLDRALALLPPMTRRVLIESYVEESPRAEVAARLGLSVGAVDMRLQRGKLILRRALATELNAEASPYGVNPADGTSWQETRIWCYSCGQRRFVGGYTRESRQLVLCCPECSFSGANFGPMEREEPLPGARANKPALTRLMVWADGYFQHAVAHGAVPCPRCGERTLLQFGMPENVPPAARRLRGVHMFCAACGCSNDIALSGLALWGPEGRRFWKEHPRIRMLPEREVEAMGQAAIVKSFESVTGTATFAVVFARDTYRVLDIHGAPDE